MTYKDIEALREKRARLIEEARRLHEEAVKADRDLNGEEQARWSQMLDDADKLGERVDLAERQYKMETELAKPQPRISDPDPVNDTPQERQEEPKPERRAAFEKFLKYGERELNGAERRALQQDSPTSGGYTVAPQEFVSELIKFVDNMTFMRRLARTFSVTSAQTLGAPALDNDPADPAWTAEIGAVSEDSTMSFGKRELNPNQLTKLLKVSIKLLRSSAIPIEQVVRDRLAYKVAVVEENAFLNGSGASQPLGVFTASSNGISTSRDVSTGNTTTSMSFDGIIEAKYSIKSQYWPRLAFITHRDGAKQLRKLKDGNGQYIWESSVRVGEPDRILNIPAYLSEYAPNTFTTGLYVGAFGDFSNYWIADSMSVEIQRLDELYAANSQVGFIVRCWTDGMPVLEEAFARVKLA